MELIIATINIRGLISLSKKKYLSTFLDENNIDIACLQEISNQFHDFPYRNYKYVLNDESSVLGTGFVIKNNLNPIEIQKDPTGRITKLTFKTFSIINLYGYPFLSNNNLDKRCPFFLKHVQKYI